METASFPKDGKLTAANILSVLHCALQATQTALTAFSLLFVMEVSTETCKNSFSTLKSIWLRAPHHMLLKTQGPAHSARLQKRHSKHKLNDEWAF